jgi:hypothetical protein
VTPRASGRRHVEARLAGRDGLARRPEVMALLDAIGRECDLWAVGDPGALLASSTWPAKVPRPRLVAAGLQIDREIDLRARLRYPDAATARRAEDALRALVGEATGPLGLALAQISIHREDATVGLDAHLNEQLTALLTPSITEAVREAAGASP